jgi:hypothetical protein
VDLEQEAQPPPPLDGVKEVPLFEPKTENFFTTFRPPHDGQGTAAFASRTSRSNSCPQRLQANS